MVTSKFALTCGSLVMNLRSCRAELAASLQTCIARLLQLCCKLKLLYGYRHLGRSGSFKVIILTKNTIVTGGSTAISSTKSTSNYYQAFTFNKLKTRINSKLGCHHPFFWHSLEE
ncbi:hypothetical protein AVEN_163486-1 [Araneus ventricosus]|uniref:Uncharacterized protein n=1 Tax=Araneus ventricosus TaxID=182803 RepID=A0A4Y2BRT9_ARAVE|nr:hypothetical protein AVEN_163486-1 [Araneus ventricosus]